MNTYTVEMNDGGGGSETVQIEAASIEDASEMAEGMTREWIDNGEWGDEGALVDAWWRIEDEDGETLGEGDVEVEIEPNHRALIRDAGGDPDCDHDWTSEGEGGLDENPGVWSSGGTTFVFTCHCRTCGLHRTKTDYGSQRNPGQHDTVEYHQPDHWCAECQSEECECEGIDED